MAFTVIPTVHIDPFHVFPPSLAATAAAAADDLFPHFLIRPPHHPLPLSPPSRSASAATAAAATDIRTKSIGATTARV